MKCISFISIFLLLCFVSHAQSNEKYISFNPQFYQIKEQANYGLVLNGLNLEMDYRQLRTKENCLLDISAGFDFGAGFTKGFSMRWELKPIDIAYGFNIKTKKDVSLSIGPYFLTNYSWQLYPEIQSGHLFWYSNIEIGPKVWLSFPIHNKRLQVIFSNAFCGFTTHTKQTNESHFYSLKASDFINNPNKDFKFGFNDLFNHTKLKIGATRKDGKRIQVGYSFEYYGQFKQSKIEFLTHSLDLNWKIGKLK